MPDLVRVFLERHRLCGRLARRLVGWQGEPIVGLSIVTEGHPALSRVNRPWDFDKDGSPLALAKRMIDAATAARGIGLSANQVDDPRRIFVMKVPGGADWLICVNPEVTEIGRVRAMESEGCLSFPGLQMKIGRPEQIWARWYDQDGRERSGDLRGILARCFQHELDHLNGRTFVDGRSVARALAKKRAKKQGRI